MHGRAFMRLQNNWPGAQQVHLATVCYFYVKLLQLQLHTGCKICETRIAIRFIYTPAFSPEDSACLFGVYHCASADKTAPTVCVYINEMCISRTPATVVHSSN